MYQKNGRQAAERVSVTEALGFITAGAVFTYIFINSLYSFQIGLLMGLINLMSGLSLIYEESSSSSSKWALTGLASALLIITLVLLLPGITWRLQDASLKGQWKEQDLITYKNSAYGKLAVTKKNEQFTFYSNNVPIINAPAGNSLWTEEFVHFGLLSHPAPKKVLFLCGGAGGPIAEALKHPLDRIDYAELDPGLITLLKNFPVEITQGELNDRRVNMSDLDGVRFVKQAVEKYDVAFINLPAPSTLQLNRYYTKEFFESVRSALGSDGRLVLGVPGALNYVSDELKGINLCIIKTLKDVFSSVHVIPGYGNIYIASVSPLEISPALFVQRLTERGITVKSLDNSRIEDRLGQIWQDWFYKNMKKAGPVKENTNLNPSGVFYSTAYWNSLLSPALRGLFRILDKLHFNWALFFIIPFMLVLFILRNTSRTMGLGIATSFATTGFAGMALNLVFIFSYQVFSGCVYRDIALFIAAFMAGLALGGWAVARNLARIKGGLGLLIGMEITMALFSLGSGFLLVYLNSFKQFNAYILFYILPALAGILVGGEFPIANKLCRHIRDGDAAGPGALYGMDLFGASCAALFIPLIFIPICGIFQTCLIVAILKGAGLILYSARR
ncbi:MAG: hypothetical protein NTV07_05315 [Candidatus Omnitrophica bacterium]|nr:hypothetical protein [Candidatus Omnitrophota bacterium]